MKRSSNIAAALRGSLFLIAALLLVETAAAEVVRQGVLYAGGTLLEAPEEGVAFTVPDGWQGIWPQGSEFFVMQPADTQVTLLATVQEASEREIRDTMTSPIPLGDGIVLEPSGVVESRNGALHSRYEVAGAQIALSAWGAARAHDRGVAVAFVLVAPEDRLERHLPTLERLIDAPDLISGPSASAGASSTPTPTAGQGASADRWDVYLKGKYLARYYTATGYTDETHLWLCSDGTFYRKGAAGGFGGGASGAFQGDNSGRWQASGAGAKGSLTLRYGDGSVVQHQLSYDYEKDHLFVDGKRWLRGTNEQCQ